MTTRKPYHGKDEPVIFGRPTIGPRVYLVKGPSGWSETYDRKLADTALAKFLAPLKVDDIVEALHTSLQLETDGEPETWVDVINYLAKITDQPARGIPEIVVIALWAQVILYEDRKDAN